jgi:hypothetical protein
MAIARDRGGGGQPPFSQADCSDQQCAGEPNGLARHTCRSPNAARLRNRYHWLTALGCTAEKLASQFLPLM